MTLREYVLRNSGVLTEDSPQKENIFACDSNGSVDCSRQNLTSLKGAPSRVNGNFVCTGNDLTSLKGAPQYVGWVFMCNKNKLSTLEGAPSRVGRSFSCAENNLTSLKGAPKEIIDGGFNCVDNKLTSLEGAPLHIGKGGWVDCHWNKITKEEALRYMRKSNCNRIIGDFGQIIRDGHMWRDLLKYKKYFKKIDDEFSILTPEKQSLFSGKWLSIW